MLNRGSAPSPWLIGMCAPLLAMPVSMAQEHADRNISASQIQPATLEHHLPDPKVYRQTLQVELNRLMQAGDELNAEKVRRSLRRLDQITRQKQVQLSLIDVIRRVLENNYGLEAGSMNPAIEATRVVEAEAAFDAVFFSTISKSRIDRPSASQLSATDVDSFSSTYGIRKNLQSGARVSSFWELNRQKIPLSFQTVNPEYTSTFNIEVRQPWLRGFGLDFNRSQIRLANNSRAISDWTFRRQVRDTLRDVEELYWRLVQARRDIAISARLLGEFEDIYQYLVARSEFDVIPVQLEATKARLERERANFIRRRASVFDAEQRLLAVMNDPELPIADNVEIIPSDFPQLTQITVDPVADSQVALDNRAELKEQELAIANARIGVGQAKNLELPRLDTTFRYAIDGLSNKADRAWDQMSGSNFQSYFITVELDLPIGNRAARAASTRARLQFEQARKALEARFEEIILDVHVVARQLLTSYEQIGPSFESTESREREVASIVARAERKDINTLNSELGAREALAAERRAMLAAMVDYNIAMVDLERAKGTLLRYNNVVIPMASESPEP